jgi:hypothetical protein
MKYTVNCNYVIVQAVYVDRSSYQPHCKKLKLFQYTVNDNKVIVQADYVDRPSNQPHCKK